MRAQDQAANSNSRTLRDLLAVTTDLTSLRDPCPSKTRSDLEFDRVLDALSARAVSEPGRALARALPFANSAEHARRLLAEAREATDLLASGEPLPIAPLGDVASPLGRVAASGVLAAQEIREIGKALEAARVLRRYLAARRSRAPELYETCSTDPTLDRLADELTAAFDADGTLSDRASPRLRELRGEFHASRQRMLSRLEDFMMRYEGILQDRFVTEREGRYVVPVRSDAHERFPGIVHATSASGSTLFVEPRAVIAMGNRLKVLEAEVEREEQAIYAQLSERIGEMLGSVGAAIEALARADVRGAIARLAIDLRLTFPRITDEMKLDLRAARHPLLMLESAEPTRAGSSAVVDFDRVVPSDLAISARKAIVVSGPNAGGKTVALKTLGLVALMVRAGLPVPCAEGSETGIFEVVLTDVGDDQSLTKSLSTFSAHVRNLCRILDETHLGALVLLDELAGGTDPREGEALAAGMLDSLTARGGAVVVTTHYEGLKALALADARFENASMGFDLATMSPTFRLAQGIPGSSSALAVARRFGLPSTVLERAERFLSREDVHFESVVRKLNDERAALELARRAAEDREREALETKRALEAEIEALRTRERKQVSREAEALLGAVRRARDDLREAQSKLRGKKLEAPSVKEAQVVIDRVASLVAAHGALDPSSLSSPEPPAGASDARSLKKGSRVWVGRLRAEAEVLELLADGSVRVQAGPLKLVVPATDLRATATPESDRKRPIAHAAKASIGDPPGLEVAIQTSDNSVDLRGLRTDDAVSMAIALLDRSLGEGRRVCFLIHGHGTGALRDAIRQELTASPYVRFFRPGGPNEGGDGVTIVWLT